MSDAIFLPDDFTETLEIEAKRAQGRDGGGFSGGTRGLINHPATVGAASSL